MTLNGKLELFTLEDLGVVDVEEIAIENSLDNASNNGYPIKLVLGVHKVSIDPVGNIQSSVAAKSKKVMCSNSFGLTGSLKHKKLWQDGYRLQPDGKGPENLGEGVLIRNEDGEDGCTTNKVVHAEGVDVGVVRRLVCIGHQVYNVALRTNECNFEE